MLAPQRVVELVNVFLPSDHVVAPTFYIDRLNIQQLINEEVLRFLLVPTFSLPSQFFFHQSYEELVEICLIRARDQLIPECAVELRNESAVVGDDIDCTIDRQAVIYVLLENGIEKLILVFLSTQVNHNSLACFLNC